MYYYRYVIIETYCSHGESSHHSIRARPLPGQDLPTSMKVECSSSMREKYPIGTKFKVWAKIKSTADAPHLYTSYRWKYDILSDSEAATFIKEKHWGK
ncbi:MAG: hypothetical protein LBE50_03610 [Gallionellaceae bacterium]|jgi:hypothetical protein|nr:hypothetical protein [Gallionellaceae bacterium]